MTTNAPGATKWTTKPDEDVVPSDRAWSRRNGWGTRRRSRFAFRVSEGKVDREACDKDEAHMALTLKALRKLEEAPPWDWPADTGEALLGVLRNPAADEKVRVLAAELAGDAVVINDELVGALLSMLRRAEEFEEARGRAAISLGPVLELCDIHGFDEPDMLPVTERTFLEIQETMHKLYLDEGVPKEVRRKILEGSVRAELDWHRDAIRARWASDDEDWRLTAVFCMRHVRGFEEQILASLGNKNLDVQVEAVLAAGTWAIDDAWPHVVGLVTAEGVDRRLLLAAIDAVGDIRPKEAPAVLEHLENSDDPEIADAVLEAKSMAEGDFGEEDEGSGSPH